jgi:enamine deaminase RidA (YjgF/YER057c/UK114 family)
LKGAGSSIEKLTQVRVYVTDIASWPAFNALYAKWAGRRASGALRRAGAATALRLQDRDRGVAVK